MSPNYQHHPSSYRDPSGFIFEKEGVLYRQVNKSFQENFDFFTSSGCYETLVKKGLLIPHQLIDQNLTGTEDYYKTIQPETIPFISYPYEWSFDMLKDAALLTLQLLKESISFGMILKDATPYNIQWHKGKLIFIDSLSFEKYDEQKPWIAYRQFCESFLSPLLLMHYSHQPLQQIQLAYPDGIPLVITKSLLPGRSRFSLHTWLHIHLHAKVAGKNSSNSNTQQSNFSKQKLFNLISSLETLISKLKLQTSQSTWSEYYEEAAKRDDYLDQKKQLIQNWISNFPDVKTAADLGANDGVFSKIIAEKNILTIATDFDPLCINHLYNDINKSEQPNILPLIIDLANPSPAIGVNNTERLSFISRTKVDLAIALAVIHHLAIGKNIPLEKIASFFSGLSNYLIVEFVPKEDEKIQFMLQSKKDIYFHYTEDHFRQSFSAYYTIREKKPIADSGRVLYFMTKNAD